jgi:excisionase family DNA binding protein
MAEIRVYTLEEVCEILSITKRTVYNYIKAGKLKAFKMGKYWRVTEENLRAFIGQDTPVVNRNRRKEHQQKTS